MSKGSTHVATSTSEDSKRASARRRVEQAAHRGEAPSSAFSEADLRWVFEGRGDELQQLEERAEVVRSQKEERSGRAEQSRAIKLETDAVLAQWEADRLAAAQAEARKRLGVDDG